MTWRLLQGAVTSDQQFSFVPRPQQQPGRFAPPSARPATDNVPTVPAVTSFDRFRPSEATDNFRFQPSPRPGELVGRAPGLAPGQDSSAAFPPRLTLEPQFPNSRTPETVRGGQFQVTAPSVEPISVSGVLGRAPGLAAQQSETTGTAFRGRKRLRTRPVESSTRSRVRSKVKISLLEEPTDEELEEADTVPPTTRSRVRSRFPATSGTRTRVPTGTRIVPTGNRKRQRTRPTAPTESEESEEDRVVAEEDRRADIATAPRRKLNRPGLTARRKTTVSPSEPATRPPFRRRLRPFPALDLETGVAAGETESPQFPSGEEGAGLLDLIPTVNTAGISVQPVSSVSNALHPPAPLLSASQCMQFQSLNG